MSNFKVGDKVVVVTSRPFGARLEPGDKVKIVDIYFSGEIVVETIPNPVGIVWYIRPHNIKPCFSMEENE